MHQNISKLRNLDHNFMSSLERTGNPKFKDWWSDVRPRLCTVPHHVPLGQGWQLVYGQCVIWDLDSINQSSQQVCHKWLWAQAWSQSWFHIRQLSSGDNSWLENLYKSKTAGSLVLATIQSSWFGSRYSSNPELDRCNGFYHSKTRTVAIGPVLPPKTCQFNLTTLPPIKYLSSDCIATWSVHRLCSVGRSFTSQVQICNSTNIRWVAIRNPQFSRIISGYSTVIQRILVGLQIWNREVKEQLKLHNLCIDHVTIRSELGYLIWAQVLQKLDEPSNGTVVQFHPCQKPTVLYLVQVATTPRHSRSVLWTCLEPNWTVHPGQTLTTGGIPWPVSYTMGPGRIANTSRIRSPNGLRTMIQQCKWYLLSTKSHTQPLRGHWWKWWLRWLALGCSSNGIPTQLVSLYLEPDSSSILRFALLRPNLGSNTVFEYWWYHDMISM